MSPETPCLEGTGRLVTREVGDPAVDVWTHSWWGVEWLLGVPRAVSSGRLLPLLRGPRAEQEGPRFLLPQASLGRGKPISAGLRGGVWTALCWGRCPGASLSPSTPVGEDLAGKTNSAGADVGLCPLRWVDSPDSGSPHPGLGGGFPTCLESPLCCSWETKSANRRKPRHHLAQLPAATRRAENCQGPEADPLRPGETPAPNGRGLFFPPKILQPRKRGLPQGEEQPGGTELTATDLRSAPTLFQGPRA